MSNNTDGEFEFTITQVDDSPSVTRVEYPSGLIEYYDASPEFLRDEILDVMIDAAQMSPLKRYINVIGEAIRETFGGK